jgi:two-component system, chemotaxis family, CheB/CheR fusion protein
MRLRGITVLLVEDDVDNLELLGAHFESEGALTLSAGSIAGALQMMIGRHVDVVVSDLELADGTGCDLMKELRGRAGMQELPAIAATGYSDQKWRDLAADCGFAHYAVKPFSLEQLVVWILELSESATNASRAQASGSLPHRAARGRLPR